MATMVTVLEGMWDTVRAHDKELQGKQVRLQVLEHVSELEESPETRRSTGADLLKNAAGWSGDDFEECLQVAYDSRSKIRF